MRYVKLILILVVFSCNYHICNLVYGKGTENIIEWYQLKFSLLSFGYVLCANVAMRKDQPLLVSAALSMISSLAVNDILDRMIFHVKYYDFSDLVTVILVFVLTLIPLQWKKIKERVDLGWRQK